MKDSKAPLGSRVFSGVEANLLGQAVLLGVNLWVTPGLIRGFGTDGYGVFTLIWTSLNCLYLLTFGTNMATQKFTAHYQGRGEPASLSRMLRGSILFNAAAGLAGLCLLWAVHGWIAGRMLQTHAAMRADARHVLACAALATPAYFLTQFSADVCFGLQRFRTANVLLTLHFAGPAVAAAVLLHHGLGLHAVGTAFVVLQWALAAAALLCILSPLRVPTRSDGGEIREYFLFACRSFASQLAWVLTFQVDRIFIAKFLPLTDLGYYSNASSMTQKLNGFCAAIGQAAFPLFAELHGTEQNERLRRFYLRSNQLYLFLVLPLSVMTWILAPQFFTLWIDSEFSVRATWPVRLLVVGNLGFLACSLATVLASGKGLPQVGAYLQVGRTLALLVLWALFIPRWGIVGAALAFLLAQCLGAPFFVGHVHRRLLGITWGAYWSESCRRPLLAAGVLAVFGLLTHGHVSSWPSFLTYGTFSMALYYAVGYRLLDQDARDALREWVERKLA
ncbi:MAG: oligosaccharide flippase family protein [Elusimicrobiota bacterium]